MYQKKMPLLKLSLLSVLFFSLFILGGCTKPPVINPEPKIIYIKSKYPKHKFLYTIKPYEITDIYTINRRYYGVNKKQLHRASETSKLLRKQNGFYKRQVQSYNRKFVK